VRRMLTSLILALLSLCGRRKLPPVPDFTPDRIAMMRFGGFGDVVAVTSLVRAVRKTWPDARIDFITDAASTTVTENNPDIDRVVVGPKPAMTWAPGAVIREIGKMRRWSQERYDLAFFMHHDIHNEFYPLFFRADYKVGFDIDDRGFDFAYTHSSCVYTIGHPKGPAHITTHFTLHYQHLLHAFTGRDHPVEQVVIGLTDAEISNARAFVAKHNLDRNLVVMAPGGADPIKIWPIERYAEVARHLLADHDASVMVMLGPAEAHLASCFSDINGRFLFDAGGNTFRENIAICTQASALASNDTGLMHVAAALRIPTAAIFGPTPSKVYGYADAGHTIIAADMACVPCNESACRLLPADSKTALAPCLDAITPERVATTVGSIITRAAAS
jgi:ADP-heptose:LPS heptosyltransferase